MGDQEASNVLSVDSEAGDDSSRSGQLSEHSSADLSEHLIEHSHEGAPSDSNRALRLNERNQNKEAQLLSTQLFSSLCDQVNACTDQNDEFLNLYEQSIGSESNDIPDVHSFMTELESTVTDITALYNELSELNKDKHDKTHEIMFSEFIAGINEFKSSITVNQDMEKKLLEEEQRLEAAKRALDEKLKQFRQKNKLLRDRMASQVTITPIQTAGSISSAVSEASNSHMASPAVSVHSQPQVTNSGQNWIQELTKELTTGFAETLVSKERRRPKKAVEPDIFSGNPTEFNDWEIDWESYVEAEELTEKEALRFIKKYLSGKAKECVIGLLSVNTPEAYRQVRRKLKDRFSTEQDIAGIFKKRLRQWPAIREPDGEKLLEFADFLDHIESSRSSVPGLYSLDEKEQNESMSQKLPHDIKLKWVEIINQRKTDRTKYPSFKDFVVFVQAQADTYMNPIMKRGNFQKPVQKQNMESRVSHRQGPVSRNYNTSTGNEQPQRKPYCHWCKNNNHQTPNCGELAKKTYKERMEFINNNRLCFRCAKHRGMAKDCKSKITCEVCGRAHATMLHNPEYTGNSNKVVPMATKSETTPTQGQEKQSIEPSNKFTADKETKMVKSTAIKRTTYNMVVPVYVSAGGIEKLVYALLDTASDSCYIDKNVATDIEAQGVEEEITMLTMNAETKQRINLYKDLHIRGYLTNSSTSMDAFQSNEIRCNISDIPTQEKCAGLPHLQKITNHLPPQLDIPVGLLIGVDCPQAICPKASVEGPTGEPFAVKTMFGWTLCGGKPLPMSSANCRATWRANEPTSELFQMVEQDFKEVDGKPASQQDLKFLEILDKETAQEADGTYVMPLPFWERPNLPCNRRQAETRLTQLKSKLKRDSDYKQKYCTFINKLVENGHAEEVTHTDNEPPNTWYIPHFGVKHPKKDKLRVVFDASAKYGNTSLNDWLLKGPDQMNDLLGILCRFRLGKIAITCDIEQMFYNFKVAERDRDYLRFLWFDHDLQVLKTYRMTRHIFGATSSPGVATYGLRKIADRTPSKATEFIKRDFYVDDGITSVDTVVEAKQLIAEATAICKEGNLRLHKIASNSTEVLASIAESERSVQNEELFDGQLPEQRTLGIEWSMETDMFHFVNKLREKPQTRRGILSTVAQIYDPMGLVSPFTLRGKNILQETCRQKLDWDDAISEDLSQKWNQWLQELGDIDQVRVSRHIKPPDFGEIKTTEIHHFSDASTEGYGACSYLRMVDRNNKVHCALILSKARVAPLNATTIPRMELQGAVTATQLSHKLKSELNTEIDKEYFWCDSTIVLGYIKNNTTKFLPYVTNRVSQIRARSRPCDWYHIPGELNPADMPSRGMSIKDLVGSCWYEGPEFLWKEALVPMLQNQPTRWIIDPEDKEQKSLKVKNTSINPSKQQRIKIENFSKLERLITAVTRLQGAAKRIHDKDKPYFRTETLHPSSYRNAERLIVRQCQAKYYSTELHQLKEHKQLPKTSKLNQLTPFLDECGIMRIGSRAVKSAVLTDEEKTPALIPSESWLAKLYIDFHHNKVQHQGRLFTQSSLRQAGIWIPGAQSLIKTFIRHCVTCKHLRGVTATQKMGDLPKERVEPTPPFTHVGVDTFGPFLVKERRTELKRWCLVFTCMYSRAVHIEVVNDLSTDSFLQAFRCLQSIRGPVSTIFSDHGTNFMGAKPILTNVTFKTNTPGASHQGGVWERTIRQIRAIFSKMAGKYSSRLDSAALRTVMYEIMHTMNSKPLTTKSLDDHTEGIITPNHLLTMKSVQLQPTPGDYTETEIYGNKMHKKVEQFANEFSSRWMDYLSTIETRPKWKGTRENIKVGDVVSVMDENSHRNEWKLGTVVKVNEGQDGLVRSASIRISDHTQIDKRGKRNSSPSILERPIQKLIVVMKV